MVLLFTEEQPELRAVVRKFLETRSSEAEVRSQMETDDGFDRQVWRQLAEQIGVRALAMPTFGSVLRRLRRREPRRRPAHRRVHGKGVLLQRLPAHRGREHPIARGIGFTWETPPICTSNEPRARRSCWVPRHIIASFSRNISACEL